jgi:two-component sensor histidine kinase
LSQTPQITIEIIDDGGGDLQRVAAAGAPITATVIVPKRTHGNWATAIHRGGGVGLSLVRGLVARELRGQFDIRSNELGGSTASFTFPLLCTTPSEL